MKMMTSQLFVFKHKNLYGGFRHIVFHEEFSQITFSITPRHTDDLKNYPLVELGCFRYFLSNC